MVDGVKHIGAHLFVGVQLSLFCMRGHGSVKTDCGSMHHILCTFLAYVVNIVSSSDSSFCIDFSPSITWLLMSELFCMCVGTCEPPHDDELQSEMRSVSLVITCMLAEMR